MKLKFLGIELRRIKKTKPRKHRATSAVAAQPQLRPAPLRKRAKHSVSHKKYYKMCRKGLHRMTKANRKVIGQTQPFETCKACYDKRVGTKDYLAHHKAYNAKKRTERRLKADLQAINQSKKDAADDYIGSIFGERGEE